MLLEPLEAGVLLLEVEDALLLELPLGETELSSFCPKQHRKSTVWW